MAKSSAEVVRDLLISNWQTAYAEYHNTAAPDVEYENDYFIIKHADVPPRKHRQVMFMRMTDNLNKAIERRNAK